MSAMRYEMRDYVMSETAERRQGATRNCCGGNGRLGAPGQDTRNECFRKSSVFTFVTL